MTAEQTDVIIVGVGASGAILAKQLATAGLKVVGLERGPLRSLSDYEIRDDIRWMVRTDLLPTVRDDPFTWRPSSDRRATVRRGNSPENQVGGAWLHWQGFSWRFHPADFKVRSREIETGVAERAGADLRGVDIQDWPVTYEELAPYYERFEWEVGVGGERGKNPFEGPMAKDYPVPPLRRNARSVILEPAMQRLGYHPFQSPVGILSRNYKPPEPYDTRLPARPGCSYCSYCSGYGCHVLAKSTAADQIVPVALSTGNFDLRPGSRVLKVNTGPNKLATGVTYVDAEGTQQELQAPLVILGCFVQDISRLLLFSANDDFPTGLANSSGLVGKYFMTHGYATTFADYDDRIVNSFIGPSSSETCIDDFQGNHFDHTGLGFIRGANIQPAGEGPPTRRYNEVPPDVPRWGLGYRQYFQKYFTRHLSIIAECESMPHEANYVDLDPDHRDRYGVPLARVTWNFTENDRRMQRFMLQKMEEIARESGASKVWSVMPPDGIGPHITGGARMGADPAKSVTNSYGQTHDIPNLLVTGAALYPTIAGYNPTETLGALCYRTADAIIARRLGIPGL
jgi:gluconate 2-dehydrogenase alpha chain